MKLTLDELKDESDTVVESQGIKVVYDPSLDVYLDKAVIDYSNNWFERGFVIRGTGISSC